MTVGHVLAFVLLLYMITAIDADVTFPKPRSSFVDLDVFKAEVMVTKTLMQYTAIFNVVKKNSVDYFCFLIFAQ